MCSAKILYISFHIKFKDKKILNSPNLNLIGAIKEVSGTHYATNGQVSTCREQTNYIFGIMPMMVSPLIMTTAKSA